MSKLKIPVTSVAGTSLSVAEMKSILGGSSDNPKSCTCTYQYTDGSVSSKQVAAEDSATCKSKCYDRCDDTASCKSVDASYSWGAAEKS